MEKLIRIWNMQGLVVHVYELDHGHDFKFDYKIRRRDGTWTWAVTTYKSLDMIKDYLSDQVWYNLNK